MFLSRLHVDTGGNSNELRPGRLWLRNHYHVHQRLCMAFPSSIRKSEDPNFVESYNPKDFGEKQVHVERNSSGGFLFRVDQGRGNITILVQSVIEPDWEYAFHNAKHFLADFPPEVRKVEPRFEKDQRLKFRLTVNPVRRLSKNSLEKDGKPVNPSSIGKRVPVRTEKLGDWIINRAGGKGFSIDKTSISIQPGYLHIRKPSQKQGQRLRCVRYEGILQVIEPDKFEQTIYEGIGRGKAFGFGLLSVIPWA